MAHNIIITFIAAICLVTVVDSAGEKRFFVANESYFSTWHQANSVCQAKGGRLATINSTQEFTSVQLLTNNSDRTFWINRTAFAGWTWEDKSPVTQFWQANGPSEIGDCCSLELGFRGINDGAAGLVNRICTRPQYAICEMNETRYNRYQLQMARESWDAAKQNCEEKGGRLAVLKTARDKELARIAFGKATSAWVGCSKTSNWPRDESNDWTWTDETLVRQMQQSSGSGDCCSLYYNMPEATSLPIHLLKADCSRQQKTICQFDSSSRIELLNQTASWEQAELACQQKGGSLGHVKTFEKNEALKEILRQQVGNVWVGCKNTANSPTVQQFTANTSVWKWTDGTTITNFRLSDDPTGRGNCCSLHYHDILGPIAMSPYTELFKTACGRQQKAFCEFPRPRYEIIDETRDNWHEAGDACRQKGGKIALLKTLQDWRDILQSFRTSEEAWIGCSKTSKRPNPITSPPDDLSAPEPLPVELCDGFVKGRFADVDCNSENAILCEQ